MALTGELTIAPDYVPRDRVVDFNVYNPAPEGGDLTHVTRAWQDMQARSKPIMWSTANGGHWFTTNGEMLRAVLRNHETFSSRIIMAPREEGGLTDLLPITADPPRHLPLRALLNQALSPRAIQGIEAQIRELARELIGEFRDRGQCEFMSEFGQQLPIGSFFRVANLPFEDYPMLLGWITSMFHQGHSEDEGSQADILRWFGDYLQPIVEERRANPGDDLISAIASGTVDGEPVDPDIALKICRTVVQAGLDTVMSLMSFTMFTLAGDKALQRRLRENPADVPRAIDEFARRFPVGVNMRILTSDIELDGVTLHKDDLIATPQLFDALDASEYDDPESIDIDRASGGHSTFGIGIHRCAGMFLARTEMKIMLEEWLRAIPEFSLAPDADIEVTQGFTTAIMKLPLCWKVAG